MNPRPYAYEAHALPAELRRQVPVGYWEPTEREETIPESANVSESGNITGSGNTKRKQLERKKERERERECVGVCVCDGCVAPLRVV